VKALPGQGRTASQLVDILAVWMTSLPHLVTAPESTPLNETCLSGGPAGPLKGRLRPPGDKSISHRAFILGLRYAVERRRQREAAADALDFMSVVNPGAVAGPDALEVR